MTINHVRMAFEESMTTNQKFIFIVLCDLANHERICWPGIWLISKRTSIDEKIVAIELEKLKESGFIKIIKNTTYMGKARSQITLVYPDKSNKKSEEQKTSYSSEERTRSQECSSREPNPERQPVHAREIAARQLAELRIKLSGA